MKFEISNILRTNSETKLRNLNKNWMIQSKSSILSMIKKRRILEDTQYYKEDLKKKAVEKVREEREKRKKFKKRQKRK